jgi:fused signal recognition particle receptor
VSETEKKGWFARFRSRGTPASEPPRPVEPPKPVELPRPAELPKPPESPQAAALSAVLEIEKGPETPVSPLPIESAREMPASRDADVETEAPIERKGWLGRLRDGLSKSAKKVTESITSVFTETIPGIFTKKKLDQATLNELEDALIQADLGVNVASRLVQKLGKERFGKEVTDEEVRSAFADDIAEILQPVAVPLKIDPANTPHVVLVIGVNGSGKTTTIAKLAHLYKGEGRKVMLAAGDTFRAAAVEQLKVWGDRAGVPVVAKQTGADAAGLAYEALEKAKAERCDVLLIDTAGRLHNKTNLMEELAKIVRVIRKLDPSAPHSCLLVLDATVGQNAHAQVETFKTLSPVDALVLTKLDGSAKGGVLVALAEKFKLPVVAIGVGEGIDDLRPFEARAFARSLMGLAA